MILIPNKVPRVEAMHEMQAVTWGNGRKINQLR